MRKDDNSDASLQKLGITLILILFVVGGSNFITSSFPQNILVSEETIIEINDNVLAFQNVGVEGANITINGKQQTANNYDTIAMGGRESVILTGKQTVFGEDSYFDGLLTVPTKIRHIALLEQASISVPDNASRILIEFKNEQLELNYKFNDVYEVVTGESKYNVQISDNRFTYITDSNNEGLFKVWHKGDDIIISLVGFYGTEQFQVSVLEVRTIEVWL